MENFDTDNMYEYTEESKPVSVIMTHEQSNNQQYAADGSSMNQELQGLSKILLQDEQPL